MEQFGEGFALTTSFGIQSSVLLHMLSTLPGGDSVPVIWWTPDICLRRRIATASS